MTFEIDARAHARSDRQCRPQLEMLGQSISFASFSIVECMTSTKYHIKSIGYLAASQCFDKETEVAVLVVNLVKKVIVVLQDHHSSLSSLSS